MRSRMCQLVTEMNSGQLFAKYSGYAIKAIPFMLFFLPNETFLPYCRPTWLRSYRNLSLVTYRCHQNLALAAIVSSTQTQVCMYRRCNSGAWALETSGPRLEWVAWTESQTSSFLMPIMTMEETLSIQGTCSKKTTYSITSTILAFLIILLLVKMNRQRKLLESGQRNGNKRRALHCYEGM